VGLHRPSGRTRRLLLSLNPERDRAIAALGDLIVKPSSERQYTDEEIEALEREVEEGFRGVTLSDTVIEERREGP
jgi:hypothetical protein